jgi:uncharacterized protein (PEP-CTERM system associated)
LPALLSTLLLPAGAWAAAWDVGASVATRLTAESNTTLGSLQKEADLGLLVRPRLTVTGRGDRLRLAGDVELNSTTYARGSLPSRTAPQGRIEANWAVVERALYLEAQGRVIQTTENPFGAATEVDPVRGTVTTRQLRVSPYLDLALSPRSRLLLRSDLTRVSDNGSTFALTDNTAGGSFSRQVLRYEVDPRPVGLRLEAERSTSRYENDLQPELRVELARASLGWMVADDFAVGLRWGAERNSVTRPGETLRIVGTQFRWAPSDRTLLSGFREDRFFGNGWRFEFRHRMPRLAWSLDLGRSVESGLQSLAELPPTANVTALLDAMFTTRFPDPVERARMVREYMSRQGLPTALADGRTLTSQRLSLVTSRGLRTAWNGPTGTVALSVYNITTADVIDPDPLASNLALRNNHQRGVSLSHAQRLSPVLGITFTADVAEIRALRTYGDSVSRQNGLRVSLNRALTPRAALSAGLGVQRLQSNVEEPGQSVQLFVGVDQSF